MPAQTPSPLSHCWGFAWLKVAVVLLLSIAATTALTGCRQTDMNQAQRLALAAVEDVCAFTPEEYTNGAVVGRLEQYSHPQFYDEVTRDPSLVLPTIPESTLAAWRASGGTVEVTVGIGGEQHPEDTDISWGRKVICDQTWSGHPEPFGNVYLVLVTKENDTWGIQELKLLSADVVLENPSQVPSA